MDLTLGPIAMLGSGETSLAGGRVFETVARGLAQPLRIAVLETPAGFELNSPQVAGRVADFLATRLQNFAPRIDVVPARKRGTDFSPDDPGILAALQGANLIFMGPGSPTYAVRQLRGSLAWDLVRARHRLGAALVFASAATVAIGARVLPVYEIYKVGQDVHMIPGLDLFADFGVPVSFIPHWNNTEGGADVDTSRCFVGIERFNQWCDLLPAGHTTVGLDEHTSLILDFASGKCRVNGVSSVTLLREYSPEIYPAGAEFPLSELGVLRWPENAADGIPAAAWSMAGAAGRTGGGQEAIPAEVLRLAEERRQARQHQDWAASDRLRERILSLGWQVQDTSGDQTLSKLA
jgi:hypothetical protein